MSSRPGALFAAGLIALTTGACIQTTRRTLKQPPAGPVPSVPSFSAGAAEIDITPPPGLPLFGYSWDAANAARGYRTRLYARALVLQDRNGQRLAIVVTDLGITSGLLHRTVSRETARHGITPDRLMLAATHTHAGPGAFAGSAYFDVFGAGKKGFDEGFLRWLAARIALGIGQAAGRLQPAKLGVATIEVKGPGWKLGATWNRSFEAWENNFSCKCLAHDKHQVDRRLVLLRVDAAAGQVPLAALAIYAIHGTVISKSNDLYHGDVLGAAAWQLQGLIRKRHGLTGRFMAAFANGAEGDVAPRAGGRTFGEMQALGAKIAGRAFVAFEGLEGRMTPVDLSLGYREVYLPGASTRLGDLCEDGDTGQPVMGGAELGRSKIYGMFGFVEGRTRHPRSCQTYKKPALGSFQNCYLRAEYYPRVAPFQLFRLGNVLTLAAVPGEPTTEMGRKIRKGVERAMRPPGAVAVVGLANGYIGYFTTPGEYRKQSYEAASSLYGPLQGVLAQEQLTSLAWRVRRKATFLYRRTRRFVRGNARDFLGERGACRSDGWGAMTLSRRAHVQTGALKQVRACWRGLAADEECGPLPRVAIQCRGQQLVGEEGQPEDDRSVRLEVRRRRADRWCATWWPPHALRGRGPCRVLVSRPQGDALRSEEFNP